MKLPRDRGADAWTTDRDAFEDLRPFRVEGASTIKSHWDGGFGSTLGVTALLQNLGGDKEITRPFLQNPWVHACVQVTARAIGSLPIQFTKGEGDDREIVEDTELNDLFEGPNPLMSQAKFLKAITQYDRLRGESFLILLKETSIPKADGKPARTEMRAVEAATGVGLGAMIETPSEIWPVSGHLVQEVWGNGRNALPTGYRVHGHGGAVVTYPAHAVVQLADANPHSILRGVGPLEAVLRETAKYYQIDRYDEALLRNGGTPGGVLSVDGPVPEGELRAIKSSWREAHETAESHRKTAILPFNTKYTPHGFTPQEMEFSELRTWIRQTIMSVFGVTKTILGITDDVNRANALEARRVFWEATVLPLAHFFEDEINYKLMRRLDDKSLSELTFSFDTSGVEALREDVDAKVDRALKIYTQGHRTFNEAAVLADWDLGEDTKLEGADERWIPANLIPPDLAAAGPPTPPPPADSEGSDEEDGDDGDKAAPSPSMRSDALDDIWRAHDVFLRRHEDPFACATFSIYRDYLRNVTRRLDEIAAGARLPSEEGAPDSVTRFVATEAELERLLALDEDDWNEELLALLLVIYLAAIKDSALRLSTEIGGTTAPLSVNSPEVLDFLRAKELGIRQGFAATLAKDLHKQLTGVLSGATASLPTLSHAIAEVVDKMKAQVDVMLGQSARKAGQIARTEVTSAVSFARVEQMKLAKVDEHTWLSSRDALVRPHHDELDGKTVRVGEVFGFNLRFPGDPQGAAEDTINCRCTTIPELPERALPLPDWTAPNIEDSIL